MDTLSTTIEQSKHLLELGLNPKTADMCFEMYKGNWTLTVGKKSAQVNRGLVIPAWSLSALLEVMPKVIVHDMNKHVLCLKYAEGVAPFMYYVVESGRNKGKLIRFDNGRCVPDAYDALDAAYQMVCWLLEQGLIKKGDNDENTSKS